MASINHCHKIFFPTDVIETNNNLMIFLNMCQYLVKKFIIGYAGEDSMIGREGRVCSGSSKCFYATSILK
jgi:hypothetical protein